MKTLKFGVSCNFQFFKGFSVKELGCTVPYSLIQLAPFEKKKQESERERGKGRKDTVC